MKFTYLCDMILEKRSKQIKFPKLIVNKNATIDFDGEYDGNIRLINFVANNIKKNYNKAKGSEDHIGKIGLNGLPKIIEDLITKWKSSGEKEVSISDEIKKIGNLILKKEILIVPKQVGSNGELIIKKQEVEDEEESEDSDEESEDTSNKITTDMVIKKFNFYLNLNNSVSDHGIKDIINKIIDSATDLKEREIINHRDLMEFSSEVIKNVLKDMIRDGDVGKENGIVKRIKGVSNEPNIDDSDKDSENDSNETATDDNNESSSEEESSTDSEDSDKKEEVKI